MKLAEKNVCLTEVQTRDGIKLAGYYREPTVAKSDALCILSHGVCGNFFSATLIDLMEDVVLDLGLTVLRINNRGRDSVVFHSTSTAAVRGGSAFELMEDAVHDLDAWVEASLERGHRTISMIGHSLGALKSLIWAYHSEHPAAKALAKLTLVSPPRFSFDALRIGERRVDFESNLEMAQRLKSAGKPKELMQVGSPFPLLISPRTFLDKYDSGDRWDYLQMLNAMPKKTAWIFGEREVTNTNSTFFLAHEQLQRALEADSIDHPVHVIPDADHNYSKAREALGLQLTSWL